MDAKDQYGISGQLPRGDSSLNVRDQVTPG
jgi:hypothetical protein